MDKLTGEELLQLLETYSEKRNKIFIPSSHDDKLANTVVAYFKRNYDYDILIKCIKRYLVKSKGIDVSLDEFVKQLTIISEEVVGEIKDAEETKELLKKTRERMEGYKRV